MNFKKLTDRMQENFDEMMKNSDCLFEVDVDKDEIWTTYLESFPEGSNPIFRERTTHDCSCCKNFIRNIGKAVTIDDNNQIKTIWDFSIDDEIYQTVIDAMNDFIKSKIVSNIFYTNTVKIGTVSNKVMVEIITDSGETKKSVITWEHFNLMLPNSLTTRKSEGMFKSEHRDNRTTLETSINVISEDSIETVLELIASNSLYKGVEWETQLKDFLEIKKTYSSLPEDEINNWLWKKSFSVGTVMSKMKNHSIGVLLTDLTKGMDLESGVKRYENIVAPHNYKRPKPIFTQRMLENAQKTVEELGFMGSLPRRFASINDLTIRNLLFVNRNVAEVMGVFDKLAKEIPINPRKFDRIEEVNIEDFIKNILPHANEIEIMVENRHIPNFVSLIAPVNIDSKRMFKWNDNNFSWAYTGNITDSSVKENVKLAGGNVSGDLRFSIQWNDIESDKNDLDAHCIEPNGYEIYYSNARRNSPNKGMLDVDIINPTSVPAVENIIYTNRNYMEDGVYKMFVRNYSHNGGTSGFRAEIEFNGNIHEFDYANELSHKEDVHVANVILKDGEFTIEPKINSELQKRTVWNITTNQFVKVSAICLSPNYWESQIGNKHFMFMLEGCINPDAPNGFFNEYLNNDLYEHRKVFEALGNMMKVAKSDEQLSGLGFSSTKHDSFIIRVKGQVDRTMKIKI